MTKFRETAKVNGHIDLDGNCVSNTISRGGACDISYGGVIQSKLTWSELLDRDRPTTSITTQIEEYRRNFIK